MKNISIAGKGCLVVLISLLACWVAPASVPGDEHWDNQFGPVGASDPLYSIAAMRGSIYVGGLPQAAGNTKANNIAGYDGTNWFALNNGVKGGLSTTYVFALATDGTNLFAGGWFTNADGSGAKNLARWDGASWWPLGGNVANNPNSIVETLKIVGTNLYAGGVFTTNGGVTVNGIAKWNGSSWSAVGSGISGGSIPVVDAIESDGTNLYIGGSFNQAGGGNATNVARWNGTSWSAMGTGFGGQVLAMVRMGGYLYAGGNFTNASLAITNLAKWDGNSWSAVGPGANRTVRDLISDGSNLYAGGDFTTIGGIAANRIAKWDGNTWSTLGLGIEGFGVGASPGVYKMTLDASGQLYVAGNFSQAGGVGASHVAGWDGANWFSLGAATSQGVTHFSGDVQCLLADASGIYAGGLFTEAGGTIVNGIGQWNGANWSAVGNAAPGMFPSSGSTQVKALAEYGGMLYAGGSFTNIGGVTASRVAQWDGSSWTAMGSGFNGTVYALCVYQGVLFAGGSFTGNSSGTTSLHGIAQWNGSDWADVPIIDVWRVNNVIDALVTDGTYLYVGGNYYVGWGFDPAYPTTGADVYNLGYWDGNYWWPVGSSMASNTVAALAIDSGVLYAGGSFTGISGIKANRVAQWNGSSWSALGTGINPASTSSGSVSALGFAGGNLYAAGSFTNAGGTAVQSIAKWDGANWSALGSGLYFSVTAQQGNGHALATSGNDVYVGGLFSSTGDKPAMFIGHWNSQSNYYPTPNLQLTRATCPTNGQFRFRVAGTSGENYTILASTNLSTWAPVFTNSTPLYDFTATNTTSSSKQFFRAVLGP